ncbi:tRNA pseudouridine(13) synthase TruD [Pseudohalioglobus sediminis]|uniref:tRNA pseudouridine synthase D n=1 Tax=Pseudohalioglobus sediminis TaxID=2606449 RepID=A0A5B0X4F3_9GAMM|nr:tRNA pseudouridine(13) synthase TruD [Pseudohalioglobus sediminis]KAA1193447.1 tRNA pseudouridine(13) synthase TruD [Pseudohalioglobus sediminis]
MSAGPPTVAGEPVCTALLRCTPEDFRVDEELGFEPEGDGEHAFLFLQKRCLNTAELAQRLSSLAGVHPRDVSFSGMKDRNAVTRQWFSVRLAGRTEPRWQELESGEDVEVIRVQRHRRKLKRGVHRHNRFVLVLRELQGDREQVATRLNTLAVQGAPNYFGPQRFGRDGSTLQQALQWAEAGPRRVSRNKRSLMLSALRAHLFNALLAERVKAGDWNTVVAGDTCMLAGTRSHFQCAQPDADITRRCADADLHPALPLWGRGLEPVAPELLARWHRVLKEELALGDFLTEQGLEASWRATRLIPDDFCWQFCDDDALQLEFRLGAGCYATALLGEFVHYRELQR